jgi:DNA-binding transcriptional regulator YhcF (GntR family)
MAQSPETTGAPPTLAPDLARADDLPLGSQLAWRLRVLIASGQLAPGDRLPGVRELATGTGVNVNTARAVYHRLIEDGLIASRHGLGTFVAEDAPRSPDLERLAAEAVEGARDSGVDPRDLARAIYAASAGSEAVGDDWSQAARPPEAEIPDFKGDEIPDVQGDERLGRRELRRQIARLEAQLASYPADSRKPGEPTHPLLRPKGHVPDMAELERIRDDLIERLKRARETAERKGNRQGRARARLERMTADPAAHKWETVGSDELGDPGCGTWEVQPKWGPVGALMNWWRVKVSSGCPLPAPREAAEEEAIVVRTRLEGEWVRIRPRRPPGAGAA